MKKLLTATILSTLSFAAIAEDEAKDRGEVLNPNVSMEMAKKIALEEVQNSAHVTEATILREEGGDWTYEVEVVVGENEIVLEISANDGEIIGVEQEGAEDDDESEENEEE